MEITKFKEGIYFSVTVHSIGSGHSLDTNDVHCG